jgi:hypothetical protein
MAPTSRAPPATLINALADPISPANPEVDIQPKSNKNLPLWCIFGCILLVALVVGCYFIFRTVRSNKGKEAQLDVVPIRPRMPKITRDNAVPTIQTLIPPVSIPATGLPQWEDGPWIHL